MNKKARRCGRGMSWREWFSRRFRLFNYDAGCFGKALVEDSYEHCSTGQVPEVDACRRVQFMRIEQVAHHVKYLYVNC